MATMNQDATRKDLRDRSYRLLHEAKALVASNAGASEYAAQFYTASVQAVNSAEDLMDAFSGEFNIILVETCMKIANAMTVGDPNQKCWNPVMMDYLKEHFVKERDSDVA